MLEEMTMEPTEFEERVRGAITAYRNRKERTVAVAEQTEQIEQVAAERFNKIVESDILPLFNRTAELLKEHCTVQIHRQEYTGERPFVVSVAMIVTPKEGTDIRRLRQPYPKLEICLRQKTLKLVIFTEVLRLAKLQLEEIDFPELTSEKLEQCVHDFVVEIFR
jgi:hypothetical protein